jgi:diadenosine tetraphosphatase ApaH/serine/threonine PP2A family protein phosphatase
MAFDAVLSSYSSLLDPDTLLLEERFTVPTLEASVLFDLIQCALPILDAQGPLATVTTPTVIVGDLHGSMWDLLRVLRKFPSYAEDDSILFLGDYVDRGAHSIGVVTLLLAILCRYPSHVFLIRGNHEFSHINREYGFYDEVMSTYQSPDVWEWFNHLFASLPLAAVVGDKIFCVHGGLSPSLTSLDQIRAIPFPVVNYDGNPLVSDLVWSDPHDGLATFADNHRGSGLLFGSSAVETFLTRTNLKLVIRAHQCVLDGFLLFARNMGTTVFSSSNYCGVEHNQCGVVYVRPKNKIELFTLGRDWKTSGPKSVMIIGKGLGMKRMMVRRPEVTASVQTVAREFTPRELRLRQPPKKGVVVAPQIHPARVVRSAARPIRRSATLGPW